MMELFVLFRLASHLEVHAFISADQSTYLKALSTQTSLHCAIEDWLGNCDDNQTTGVYLFERFDTTIHNISLQTLSMYGVKHDKLEIIIGKRKQAEVCQNKFSSVVDIITAVPQGLMLEPFLFLLFINCL